MTDLDITHWIDFVRGFAKPEHEQQMRDDLIESEVPRRTVEALRRVNAVGRSDACNPVPASAVRIAKAIGSTSRDKPTESIRRLTCRLAFDSLLQPATAGARGLQEAHRELTFETQGYSLDLRLEDELTNPAEGHPSSTARRVVVGQLLKLDDAPEERRPSAPAPVSRAPVFIFSEERMVGKTLTGHHGEFQVEGPPRESLDLCILAGEDYLEMPLKPGTASYGDEETS